MKKEVVEIKNQQEWDYVKNKINNPANLVGFKSHEITKDICINIHNGEYDYVNYYILHGYEIISFDEFKSRYEPKLKIGDTFKKDGFVCEVKEKVDLGKWYRVKTTRKTYFTKITEKRKRYYNKVDIVEITNKEFIKQLEENAR